MPRSRAVIFVLLAALLAPTMAYAASLEEQVKAAYAAFDAAFNNGDAKAVAAFYVEDAVILPPTHDVIKGPAGAEKFFTGLFAPGVTEHKLELIEANGDDQLTVAAARWSAKGKDGTLGGLATHEFAKQADGNLKLRLHTFN
jgi:ketosteroid isomerase-like protein